MRIARIKLKRLKKGQRQNSDLFTICPHRGATDLSKLRFTSTNFMRFANKEPANSRTVDDSLMSSKVLKQHAWKPPGRYESAKKNTFCLFSLFGQINTQMILLMGHLPSMRISAPFNFLDMRVNIIQENVRTSTSLCPHRPDKNLTYFGSMKT